MSYSITEFQSTCETQHNSAMACKDCETDVSMVKLSGLLDCLPGSNPVNNQDRPFSLVKTLDFENTLSVEGNVLVASRGALPRQSSEGCVRDIMNGPDGILSFQRNVW